MNHKIVTNSSDKPAPLGPMIDAMELREFEIISTENKDAVIEFETGVIDWDSGPRGTFRFAIDLTSLGVLGRQSSEAARVFSAENYAIAAAKLEKTPRGDLPERNSKRAR